MSMTRREKLVVAGVPIVIVMALLWWLWISPKLVLLGIAGGSWGDYSRVRDQDVYVDTVVSFKLTSEVARDALLHRLEFQPHYGDGTEIAAEALRSAGISPRDYRCYISKNSKRGGLVLFLERSDAVIVRINY
jgi:hypothetical protein